MIKLNNKSFFEYIPPSASAILVILFVVLCAMSFVPQVHRWGDTSTYYMQIQSIAEDHDIQYLPNDIHRAIETRFDDLPAGLFLIKTDEGEYFYGKEYSYALFASPFYKLFGNNGILLFNSLMFYAMILMGYLYLRKENGDLTALCTSIIFFVISTTFVYNFWIHAEIYNMFLIMSGLFLWILYVNDNGRKYLIFASLVFGIAAVAKIPNIVLFMPLTLYELYKHRFKNFGLMVLTFSIVISAFYGYFYLETGAASFYGGHRLGYAAGNYPFINGYDNVNEAGSLAFSVTEGRIGALINTNNLKSVPYNLFYYFFGRFTGIMWYYPLAIFSFISVLVRFSDVEEVKSDPKRILILFGIILYILFFVIIIGNNYLGGAHAVGNRYFYVYPAFLFLMGGIRYKRLIPFLILAIITIAPIIIDPIENSKRPDVHTFSIPYNYFPFEYSQLSNLPLWAHIQRGEIYPTYVLKTDKRHADYLIKTDSEVNSFDLLLWSYHDNNLIDLEANNYASQIILDRPDAKILTLNNISPEYSDVRGFIYKVSIYSSDEVGMRLLDRSSWQSSTELTYGYGWHGLENWSGTPTRWMGSDAMLFIYSDENRTAELDLQVLSYRHPRTLEIYVNGRPWIWAEVPSTNFVMVKAPPIDLKNGINMITFHVPERCESPRDATGGKSLDPRCLSLAFQDIKLIKDILINNQESLSVSLTDDWHGLEDWSGTPTRWMSDDATLMIYSDENRTADLSFHAHSFYRPRTLEIYVNGPPQIWAEVPTEGFVRVNVPISLNEGANLVRFHVPEGCERPCDIPELESIDSRCLSVAVQNVTIDNPTNDINENIAIGSTGFLFSSLADDWHSLEDWCDTPTRWMSDDATLMIYSDENRTAELSLQAFSFYRPRTLEIYVNDLPHIWVEVPTNGFVMVKVPTSLNEGANLVRFHVPEGCERPCDIPELESIDSRCLSVAVQNVTTT